MENKLLFVYGSLLRGLHNHSLLDNEESSLLGEAVTAPEFSLLDLGSYPGLSLDGTTSVKGEVYSVSEAVYRRVEMLEGYPSYYDRTTLSTPYGTAEAYFLEGEEYDYLNKVDSGDWREYYEAKRY